MNIEFYADIDKAIPNEVIQNVISYMSNVFDTDVRCFIESSTPSVYRVRPTLTFESSPFSTAEDEDEIPF